VGSVIPIGVGVLVLLTIGVTVLALVWFVWRFGYAAGWRTARQAAPQCPRCGYSFVGLTQCRCPECGTEFSLDEIWRTPLPRKAVRRVETDHATP
jgi:hypothetical protein